MIHHSLKWFAIINVYLIIINTLILAPEARAFPGDFKIGRTTFLSRLSAGRTTMSSMDLGIGPRFFNEQRDHNRTVYDVRTPYNAHYDWEERFPMYTIKPALTAGLSGHSLLSVKAGLGFSSTYDRTPDSSAQPASAGANTTTVEFLNPRGEARRMNADASLLYANRVSRDSEFSFGYDFQRRHYIRNWDYRVLRSLNAALQANRQNYFDMGDDLNRHDLWLGYAFFFGPQPAPGLIRRDLDFFHLPGLPRGASFAKIKAGVSAHRDMKTRRYQFEDSIFIAFSGISVPEFVFQQEEEFSNVPRVVHDNYTQPFIEVQYAMNSAGPMAYTLYGRHEIYTSWQREIDRFDGPRFAPEGVFEPADARVYWGDDNVSNRRSWDIELEARRSMGFNWDAFITQSVRGRRDGNLSAFSTNWTQGTAPFRVPGRDTWEEDISEDILETRIGLTRIWGFPYRDRLTPLDLVDGGLPARGQHMLKPYAGYKIVRYDKDFNYIRDNVGPQWIRMGMDYGQWFVGLKYLTGFGSSTFSLNARWDIPASYCNDASWWWNYGGGDFAPPSDGIFEGETTSLILDSSFRRRLNESCNYKIDLNYAYSRATRDYTYGAVIFGGAPLNWTDRYDLTLNSSSFDLLFGIELLR
jgi:hypothetical protein